MSDLAQRFRHQLAIWSLHVAITAIPSFFIAGILLSYFDSAAQTLAMLPGIAIFVVGCAALTTFVEAFHDPQHQLSRALKGALRIRIGLLLFSLFGACFGSSGLVFLLLIPDFWAGVGGASVLFWSLEQLNLPTAGNPESFGPGIIFLWTVLQGLLLTLLLSLMTFFCLIILNFRQKRAWQVNAFGEEKGVIFKNVEPCLVQRTTAGPEK